jgi:hypothetical protein
VVEFLDIKARMKGGSDKREILTQYVTDCVTKYGCVAKPIQVNELSIEVPFDGLQLSTPKISPEDWDSSSIDPEFVQYVADQLDKLFPFPSPRRRAFDNVPRTFPPWSVPLPLQLTDVSTYIFPDMRRVRDHLRGVNLQYDKQTHSVRPVVSKYHRMLKEKIPLDDYPFILQAFWKAYDLLSEWMEEMDDVGVLIPFPVFLDCRSRQAAGVGGRPMLRHPSGHIVWTDPKWRAMMNKTSLQPGGDPEGQWELVKAHWHEFKALADESVGDNAAGQFILEPEAEHRLALLGPEVDAFWYRETATLFALTMQSVWKPSWAFDDDRPELFWAERMWRGRREMLQEHVEKERKGQVKDED